MYYRRALKLQAFLDMASDKGKTKLLLLYERYLAECIGTIEGTRFLVFCKPWEAGTLLFSYLYTPLTNMSFFYLKSSRKSCPIHHYGSKRQLVICQDDCPFFSFFISGFVQRSSMDIKLLHFHPRKTKRVIGPYTRI